MKKSTKLWGLGLALMVVISACKKNRNAQEQDSLDELLLVTNITSSNPVVAYVGTIKNLGVGSANNTKARQSTQYPFIAIKGDDVYVIPNKGGDVLRKYKRQRDGSLAESGSLTLPSASQSISVVIENDTKGYISLQNTGKIAIFNPSTLQLTGTIDLTSYAIGDASPDPSVMALRDGKLYVACVQTSDGYTSTRPAQVLVVDVANGNVVTSITDSRTNWAGSIDEAHSIFFDEKGDLYVFCVASYGFIPGQKCGFIRIKKGTSQFDPDYFFNVADHQVTGVPGNKVDYLQHMRYTSNGILYATGNIYALGSNPPNYITDRTMASFKVDLYNKQITKLSLPYSNGYSASVSYHQGKVLFGLSTNNAVGIYTYDPVNGTASSAPVVTTQGDPSLIEHF